MEKQLQKRLMVTTIVIFLVALPMLRVGEVQAQVVNVPTAELAINGKAVNGINPIKIDGVYYLPFVPLAKSLGYNHIKFFEATHTYEATDGSTTIRMTTGGTRAKKGNEYVNIKPPRWINGMGYVSLHAGGALFNTTITFVPKNGSIQIQKPAQQYIVHSGDTLFNIARIHHTSVDKLKAVNKLTSNLIIDGQVLKLPTAEFAKEIEPIREHEPVKNINQTTIASQRQKIIEQAKKYIGAAYKFGATVAEAPKKFDCSSYTQFVFSHSGITLPRVSRDQAMKGTTVSSLVAGDLMFFTQKELYSDGRVGHVGIYMGDGNMIHASTSKGVTITTNVLKNPYWKNNYLFSKRVIQ